MTKIDATALETLRERLQKMPTRTTISPYELVVKLEPAISAARERGQDFEAIAVVLAELGARIKPATIRNYLWRARRVRVKEAPPVSSKSSAPIGATLPPESRPLSRNSSRSLAAATRFSAS